MLPNIHAQMFFFWLETDIWESFTAIDYTPSPTLKLDCPLVKHSEPAAEPVTEPAAVLAAEPIAVPLVSSILSLLPLPLTPPSVCLPAGLYRAALYTGPVAAAASHFLSFPGRILILLPGFRCLIRRP